MTEIYIIILVSAVLNYMTRIGGHLLLSRLGTLNPRLEAGLNAGVIPILVETGYGAEERNELPPNVLVVSDIGAAGEWILEL